MRPTNEVVALIDNAKAMGILKIEIDGVVYHLDQPAAPKSNHVPDLTAEEIVNPLSVLDEMDDDEILYWSSPYYEEIQNKKELQKQMKAESEN